MSSPEKIQQFQTFLATALNADQKKAVERNEGVLLVVAGAGSGKTRVITARILNLILNESVEPTSIVALTFTNKAATEMRERIVHFLGTTTNLPFIGTFHSYCLRLLKANLHLLGMPSFSILDEDDQHKILSGIIARNNLGKRTTAKKIAYQISHIKNSSIDPAADLEFDTSNRFIQEIYASYEHEKKSSHCLDFDDLLLETLKLFKKNGMFKKNFQEKIRHVLVDEYQDTNVVQHALLKELTQDNNGTFKIASLCVVGDEDQSIYSWRGATITNIINFKKDFPQTNTIKIEQNYRSVQPILTVANAVIQQNTQRNPKNLWSERQGSDRIRAISCLSEYQEADVVAQFLKTQSFDTLRTQDRQKPSKQEQNSVAILYRAHHQSRALEEALIKNSIPYKIIGGIQFYERKEIKDILAYLRLVVNPFDRAAFSRVINCPPRGLGDKFEEEFYNRWNQELLLDFKQVAHLMLESTELPRAKKASLVSFLTIFNSIEPTDRPSAAIDRMLSITSYMNHVRNSYEQTEAESRLDNIKELIHAVRYLEDQGLNTITHFLDEVALMQEKLTVDAQNSNETPVLLMTLHAAKGLEFDTVILTGLEEGLLPSMRSMQENESVEEERRLFYVGITRAKERLLLTTCRYRYTYGQMNAQLKSRFLEEIPSVLAPHHDASNMNMLDMKKLFGQWLGTTPVPIPSNIITFGTAKTTKKVSTPETPTKVTWKKHQPVQHKTFGTGIIDTIEHKDEETIYLTIKFKGGTKKVNATFVTPL